MDRVFLYRLKWFPEQVLIVLVGHQQQGCRVLVAQIQMLLQLQLRPIP